jgi:hypothetical protein
MSRNTELNKSQLDNVNIVDDILNDNTDYSAIFDEYNSALQSHDMKNAERQQAILDSYFKKFNDINQKYKDDLKINNKNDITRTQSAIGKLVSQNPNFSIVKPLYLSSDIEMQKKLVVEKLDKLLAIYPDYQAVYSYLTSPEAEIEIAQNPQKLDDIVKKINAFLLQYPIIQDANKFEDTPVINLSLKQVYKNTIQTAIDVINDISLIVSRKDSLTNAQLRRSIFRTLTSESRKLYVGIWLIFFSFVIYFIDSSV